jgi:hypothetical protein
MMQRRNLERLCMSARKKQHYAHSNPEKNTRMGQCNESLAQFDDFYADSEEWQEVLKS